MRSLVCWRYFHILIRLFCSEDPVACISQPWADVGIFIQTAVKMTNIDLDIRMCLFKAL